MKAETLTWKVIDSERPRVNGKLLVHVNPSEAPEITVQHQVLRSIPTTAQIGIDLQDGRPTLVVAIVGIEESLVVDLRDGRVLQEAIA